MLDNIIYRLSKMVVRLYCSIFMKLHVQGLENIPRGSGGILAANHPSPLDAFLLHSLMKKKI
ncbi:MAG: 1-acyl-sn-glycerol-3-phosphate acyltransferase, partial [Deltaproteobacteria bacterium]|nr:1-acyl-sn-glycerol-3-phosphate acyltransferase [Deltaproteobacteria bacterium]